MGRAIVRNPDIFLFDEPLSNLDAKLRTQMRVEIKELHQRVKNTIIYVTHDQTEAMTMADRIVVMGLSMGGTLTLATALERVDEREALRPLIAALPRLDAAGRTAVPRRLSLRTVSDTAHTVIFHRRKRSLGGPDGRSGAPAGVFARRPAGGAPGRRRAGRERVVPANPGKVRKKLGR